MCYEFYYILSQTVVPVHNDAQCGINCLCASNSQEMVFSDIRSMAI
jgi:hypothetical protein